MHAKENFNGSVRPKHITYLLIYFCAVLAVFVTIIFLTSAPVTDAYSSGDLAGFDFSSAIAYIDTDCFEFYPKALYTPKDFTYAPVLPDPSDTSAAHYGTYRLILNLTPGNVYGLSGYSATFAQTLWIDGKVYSAVGMPGDSVETTSSQSTYFTVYFEAKTETEIIVQWANHVHSTSGQFMPLYLGEQPLISHMVAGQWLRGCVVVGCMLMASLFFFGIFLFFRKRRQFIWFSLACMFMAIHTLFLDHKIIMTLFPEMPWEVSHRSEYVIFLAFAVFFFLYIDRMFDRRTNRIVNIAGLAMTAFYIMLVLLAPALIYTRFMPYMRIGALTYAFAVIAQLVWHMARRNDNRRQEHLLIFFGAAAYVGITMLDLILHDGGRHNDTNFTQVGMMVFVFANTLALALNFNRIETELQAARENEREMTETNQLLERLNRVKSDFLGNISHEMRTPLTVISGKAGLTLWQIQENAVNSSTEKNLDIIQREAVRLGGLVEQLKDVALEKERRLTLTETEMRALLQKSADYCAPVCRENRNKITVHTKPERFFMRINADAVFQVLVNLITNANRHTRDGEIAVSADLKIENKELEYTAITVTDTGSGIPPELLPMLFRRGVSGSGSTGLGLTICKEIIEEHGGSIEIDSEQGSGTVVSIALPIIKEGEKI